MISLKTLHLATAQEVFDQVKDHLLKQNAKSFIPGQGCMYRGENGMKCAAGCLIADDEYSPEFEGASWAYVISFCIDHGKLISFLQKIHDCCNPSEWESELKKVAELFNLKWEASNED